MAGPRNKSKGRMKERRRMREDLNGVIFSYYLSLYYMWRRTKNVLSKINTCVHVHAYSYICTKYLCMDIQTYMYIFRHISLYMHV